MSKHGSMLQLAISGVLALSGAALTSTALAADDDGREQCAGIVKATKNDCATSANDCHGHVNTDGNAEAWLKLGEVAERLKDSDKAREAYQKYLELASDAKNAAEIRKKVEKLK